MKKNRSIRFLLLAALASAFTLVLAFTLLYANHSQRAHMEDYTRKYVEGLQKSYFDALNTMMVTGTIANQPLLRERTMAPPAVLDVRVVRSDKLNALYGPGADYQRNRSPEEMQALQGERVERYSMNDSGRVFTLLEPIVAMADYQGVNCLLCHQANEGDILGAIRVDYSLAESDARLNTQLVTSASVQILIFLLAFAGTAVVLGRLVTARLRQLHDRMESIASNSDLTIRLDDSRNDEIGSVARAFNRMVGKINASMHLVVDNAGRVQQAAEQIAHKADTTVREVMAQKDNTDQVASATTEMAASAVEVRENAVNTSRKSLDTTNAASNGEQLARKAVQGIEQLNAEVQEGARRIAELDQRTSAMNEMLTVIATIADQTNLLALNAAIEAARAGEAGRGFAVVADEVRSLAMRTKQSTNEIEELIRTLQQGAEEAVRSMGHNCSLADSSVDAAGETGRALQAITQSVSAIQQMNQQIAAAAEQQSAVAEGINRSVMNIRDVADQSAAASEETSASSADLARLSGDLQQQISRFRLR